MRKLMAERKNKDKKPTKINNPLAKYNNAGQLMCILCSSIVRSENVWQVHINSKQHRENVEQAKKLKELTNNFTEGKVRNKRPCGSVIEAPQEKRLKGILKNAHESPVIPVQAHKINAPTVASYHDEEIKRSVFPMLPADKEGTQEAEVPSENIVMEADSKVQTSNDQPIPEGFFDDPILDAKVSIFSNLL
ncbi:unnamed protein product [Parnassius apollo]|uniref:(apollo) hypothetical protein n=1 Tax=Parnassius apollo TaxID=110799 RepID=A0A8S3X004_PARAO|nr:unnamed protein product [Parnassius apollo]